MESTYKIKCEKKKPSKNYSNDRKILHFLYRPICKKSITKDYVMRRRPSSVFIVCFFSLLKIFHGIDNSRENRKKKQKEKTEKSVGCVAAVVVIVTVVVIVVVEIWFHSGISINRVFVPTRIRTYLQSLKTQEINLIVYKIVFRSSSFSTSHLHKFNCVRHRRALNFVSTFDRELRNIVFAMKNYHTLIWHDSMLIGDHVDDVTVQTKNQ